MACVDRFKTSLPDDGGYRLLLEAVTDYAIYMLDADGIVTSWNPGAQRFKGYRASEIVGQHFSCFYGEEDRRNDVPRRALETAAKDGRFENEGWRYRKNGSRFWAHVIIDPIFSPAKELIGFAKVTRDISERKATQERLKLSEERYRILVKGVTDYAIYTLDPEGRIVSWNLGAQKIKGYLPHEIIGQHFSKFYTPEDREKGAFQIALETAAREGHYENEAWRVRKDGTYFWANVVIDAIRDDDGHILGFAKITRDVTERLEAQRAHDKTREELFQSQKIEALGKLTGGVAHDFNNLLGAILGSLEVVRKYLPEGFKGLSLFDNAVLGAERGVALTQRLLSFARRQDLNPELVEIPQLLQGMNDLMLRAIGPSVSVETRIPDGLPAVLADINQLELSLLNLAMNARDAMPDGGTIVIVAREIPVESDKAGKLKPGRYIGLSVTDTGDGMDEATLARATEPFFTTKGAGKGTGLGLSTVYGMAEQSGGQLILTSQKGAGTTAEIWLPAAEGQYNNVPARPGSIANKPEIKRPLAVLAVDDDPVFLMSTTAMLRDLGHAVWEANSAREALDLLQWEKAFDLIITDHAMPQMTGTQLARTIKAGWPNMPILLATGYADLASGPGCDLPRLTKPFGQAELADAVAAMIG